MEYPFISVIIPTYNREEPLCETLKSLFNQDYPKYEIIVVDQSQIHKPETLSFLEKNKNKFFYLHIDKPSLPHAKNLGASCAKGEILLFCDDDILAGGDFLSHHASNYSNPHIGGVASRIIVSGFQKKPFTLFRLKHLGVKVALSGRSFSNLDSDKKKYVFSCLGGPVISIRKVLFDRVGGFDTSFLTSDMGCEDVDFGYRLRRLGAKVIYEPKALAIHKFHPLGGCRIKDKVEAEYRRFYSAMLFYLKNMNKFFVPYMVTIYFFIAIRKILLPTKRFKDFFYVLSGLWDGFKTYIKRKKNGK